MPNRNAKQKIRKGLLTAGLLLLCACAVGCSAAEVTAGIFSFDVKAFVQSFTEHYTGASSSTSTSTGNTVLNGTTGTVTTKKEDDADAIAPVETLTLLPTLAEDSTAQSSSIWIDYSNADQGYIMAQYIGNHTGLIKMQIKGPDGITYTYSLAVGDDFCAFPLTGGDGSYTINTYEQDSGTSYYLVDSVTFTATLADPLLPYLYPNQFVNYSQESSALALSIAAATGATTELEVVAQIYDSVMGTLSYDYDLAELISSGGLSSYIPDLDSVLQSKVGICFDYASLMVAMLRMQGVPAKLVIGYAGEAYHAWINVYTEEEGWVDGAIYFNGYEWALMDPTFADTSGSNSYVGDGENYTEKYVY